MKWCRQVAGPGDGEGENGGGASETCFSFFGMKGDNYSGTLKSQLRAEGTNCDQLYNEK